MTRQREPFEWGDWSDDDYVGFVGHAQPLYPLDLTDAEVREERKRLRERLARKKPVGFRHPEEPW